MPIYEYECEVCGHTFEVIQKFSDDPIKVCVDCSGPVHRVLSPPGLVFKGTGWYVTDYAGPERKKAMEGEKREHKGDEASADTNGSEPTSKTDTKADTGTSSE
ncbi:MAG: FmdB family zinc ribbon protein [Candidatus Methylomirabilales bacterium]